MMFWWTLLWLFAALAVAGASFRMGWNARGSDDIRQFLAKLDRPRGDDPPEKSRV